jgi:hypothetical protein
MSKWDIAQTVKMIYGAFQLPPEYFEGRAMTGVDWAKGVESSVIISKTREGYTVDTEFVRDVRQGVRLGLVEEGSLLSLMTDPAFVAACKAAGVEPTRRQASKWKNARGRAFAKRDRSREPFPDYRAPRARDHEEF